MIQDRCLHPFARTTPLPTRNLPRTSKTLLDPQRLCDPLTVLPGVGPATAREAVKLGLRNLGDLIFHFPHRHEDFTAQKQIGELKWGDEATVSVTLQGKPVLQRTRRRNLRIVKATVRDATGYMQALWFNQDYLKDRLSPGAVLMLRGSYDGASQAFRVRSHELLGQGETGLHTSGFVPVYPTTGKISVKRLRGWLGRVRDLAALLSDPLPARLLSRMKLPRRADAILTMHFPHSQAEYALAQQRLVFEELFLMQLGLLSHMRHFRQERRSLKLGPPASITRGFLQALPFELTLDQKKVSSEISRDLQKDAPMQRLLQGDVGSGKTVVAVYALLRAVESGAQAAFMAPTEVLAEQHYLLLQQLLAGLEVRLAFLSSRLAAAERKALLTRIGRGEVDIAVGTHALIQEDVDFQRLAVVVVDEQHRFGVRQREELADKATRQGMTPHVLHMTATPIPRTLALTLYGDLEVSVIGQMPTGRRKVRTWLIPEAKRAGAYGFIREQLDAGRQCYVVCPLIEESEAVEATAVEVEADRLKETEFTGYQVAALHGQMPTQAKQEVMRRFVAGEIQVLVSTTVIEVGVDVPNATIMMVEEADRFGLAQLHQLRGRVGRGQHESYCLLFGDPRTPQAEQRLSAITGTSDGFRLADLDLEIRGEGQIFGARQSGMPDLKLARLARDRELLNIARERAEELIASDPSLCRPAHALLREGVEKIFGEAVAWLHRI